MSRSIESVAVIGAGTMGAGIAAASASAGCRVLILDTNPETVDAALQHRLQGPADTGDAGTEHEQCVAVDGVPVEDE